MNERVGFLKSILSGNWDAAGVFADWLEEHGDPLGVLLRRRWQRWRKEHEAAVEEDREVTEATRQSFFASLGPDAEVTITVKLGGVQDAADSFRMYLRRKFPQECYEASDPTNSQAYTDA